MRAEPVTEPLAYHGEGPIWDPSGRLLWVDMLAGDVLGLEPQSGAISRLHVAGVAACVVPRSGGGHAVATERGFVLLDADGETERVIPDAWDDAGIRMNDGGCDPAGRFLCGSMAYDARPGAGALYRLDPDGSVRTVLDGVTISNGIAWSDDGRTMYYVDSPTKRIDAFDYDVASGRPSGRRTVVEIPVEAGTPDGLTLDADGAIWVALWGGAAVHRYLSDGRLDAVVEVGVPQPSSCAFGGADLGDLYITTSAEDLAPSAVGASGALFVCRPGIRGLPTPTFAG